MSSDEFTHWIAYYSLEPFGQERDNIHAGIVASTLANINGGSRKTWTAKDFMVIDKVTRQKQSTAQFLTGLKALAKKKDV